jgi:preprotein translocase subunit YajC
LIGSWRINPIVLAADPGMSGGLAQFVLLFAPLFLIWYFLVIRPQQQQRRKTQDMLANLKTGDRVITSGGIYGTITGFRESVVQLQVASQVRIDVARSAITGLQPSEGGGEASAGREKDAKGKK